MVKLLARVLGVGIETADMLVQEVLSRNLRDRRAVARYAGLTGSPDESGSRRGKKGLAKSGNPRVRRGLIQLAWRFLRFQRESVLARWFRSRTEGHNGRRKTTMIVALARKLLIAFWRMTTIGEIPQGIVLRPSPESACPQKRATAVCCQAQYRPMSADNDPRWWQPACCLGSGLPDRVRMGPPPRSPVAEANDCFTPTAGATGYKVREHFRVDGRLPSVRTLFTLEPSSRKRVHGRKVLLTENPPIQGNTTRLAAASAEVGRARYLFLAPRTARRLRTL